MDQGYGTFCHHASRILGCRHSRLAKQNIDSILSIAQKQVHDGSIILMHDGYQTSVDAALKIADLFTEKGYVFVTADQLLLT